MRVENASIRLNNTDGLIERRQSVWSSLAVGDHSRQIEFQVLWLKLCSELVANTLALAGGNLNIVSRGCQVTDILGALLREGSSPKAASNKGNADGFRFVVGEGEKSLGRLTID